MIERGRNSDRNSDNLMFERVYKKSHNLREEDHTYEEAPLTVSHTDAEYNFSGDEGKPSGDGVPDCWNTKLFESIYRKSQIKN